MPGREVGRRWGKVPLHVTVELANEGRALAVYCALAAHANRAGEAWPSQSTLADLLGCSTRTVGRAVRTLEQLGHVAVVEVGTGPRSTRYRLTASRVDTGDAPGSTRKRGQGRTQGATEQSEQQKEQLAADGAAFLQGRRRGRALAVEG